jgi:DNA-binding response OmpR family regulator
LEAFNILESIRTGEHLPGILVLDLNMPVWSGMETLKAIKEHQAYREIPAYIFTNSDHDIHRENALKMGAADFITKPYHLKALREVCITLTTHAERLSLFKMELQNQI